MPRPFEVDAEYLAGHLDEMVDSVFGDLESQFLVLPKGPNFVEYADFQNAYEVLKRRTDAFRTVTPDTIWASLQDDGLSFVVLRTILGFSPPEWADLARSDFNVNVPQGTARVLDTRCRHERGYFARLTEGRNKLAIERINGLIAAAVKYITQGAPAGAANVVHRLAKVDTSNGTASLTHVAAQHVPYLPRIHASAMEELEEMGVECIRDIPDDFELTEIQRRAATCVQTGKPWFDTEGLESKLGALKYPLSFMDFETVNPAIPRFSGMRPYDHLPFQFSVHVQQQPGAEPEHYEFLATDANDPRREFISSLCAALDDIGKVIVYSSFECQRLSDLACWFPEFADRVNAIKARLFDLLPIVREHTYHAAYAGSYSIKSALPALVPEMTYAGMEVSNGQDAGLAWEALVRGELGCNERDRIRKALLDYCALDTLAMVRLLIHLRLAPNQSER